MNGFTSGIVGDNPKYYLVSCSAYRLEDDQTAFSMAKSWHRLDEKSYIDDYEVEYCKIKFTEGTRFNIEWCEPKTPFAYKCRLYEIYQ